MTFDQYWNILLKRWKLIVVCFVAVGLGAYIGSKLITPLFQSTALVQITISLNNNQADYTSLLASDQLVQTEAQLAISDPVLREVASHYPGMAVGQLTGKVSTVPQPNTQLFQINVLDPSPARAAALANDIAETLIKQQAQVTQQESTQSQQQLQQDLQQTQRQISTLTNQIATLQAKKGNGAQVSVLEAQLNALQQHYSKWQSTLAQLELTEAQSSGFLRVAQSAQPALNPSSPNVLLNTAVGLLAGLLNGFLLAILFEQLDTRVRSEEALTQLVDWPVLATIWYQDSSKGKQENTEELVNPPEHSANVEAYRILRTNIGFSMIGKPLRTIIVLSATPHDGKSTVATNLAIFMAKAGKKTLLIDADLRRPTLGRKFHLPADKMGLSNAILACSQPLLSNSMLPMSQSSQPFLIDFSLDSYMHRVDIPNLRVMPSGPLPPNPPELFDSEAMGHFFATLANCGAEVIVFDSPPLLGLSDANILAPKVDGVLIVVDSTSANKKKLKQMKTLLAQSGSNVLGCIMNKQRRSRQENAYSYYYYYRTREEDEGRGKSSSKQNGHVPPVLANSRFPEPPGRR